MFVNESALKLNTKLDAEIQDLHREIARLLPATQGEPKRHRPTPGASDDGNREDDGHDVDNDENRPSWVADVIKAFEGRVDKLENKVQSINAETDEAAIKFAGLGFRSAKETGVWLETEIPNHSCGLIVDAQHVVLEHVNAAIEGQETITCLEKLSRLKIKTIADGLALTSFEHKLPHCFSAVLGHKIVKANASFFNKLRVCDGWDLASTGHRDRLKEELTEFKVAHSNHITNSLDAQSRAHAITMLALTDAVAWIEGFIVFLDDCHKELTQAKFGSKKAWHATTCIGRGMFTEIAVPRNGIQRAFEAGQNAQITQKIAWAVFRAHDIMARYRRHAHKDDPTVASELVKFLSVNTGIEAVKCVVLKVAEMESDASGAKREAAQAIKAAVKAAGMASNKVDELKKQEGALAKRLAKTSPP